MLLCDVTLECRHECHISKSSKFFARNHGWRAKMLSGNGEKKWNEIFFKWRDLHNDSKKDKRLLKVSLSSGQRFFWLLSNFPNLIKRFDMFSSQLIASRPKSRKLSQLIRFHKQGLRPSWIRLDWTHKPKVHASDNVTLKHKHSNLWSAHLINNYCQQPKPLAPRSWLVWSESAFQIKSRSKPFVPQTRSNLH